MSTPALHVPASSEDARVFLELVESRASRTPARVAIEVYGQASVTWSALLARTRAFAAHLDSVGASPGDRLVFSAGRSLEFVVVLLACLDRGVVFVPVAHNLGDVSLAGLLERTAPVVHIRSTAEVTTAPIGSHASALTPITISPNDPAYIAFTSGSSGRPKGVVVARRSLATLARAQADAFRVGPTSRTSFGLAAHFDAAFSDVLVPLIAGATLVVVPLEGASLIDVARATRLTHVDLPPSSLAALLASGLPPSLETLIVGGELPNRARLRRISRCGVRALNVYGPTETTVCASVELITEESGDAPSIGRPLPGVEFDIEPSTGELLIGGWGVALGYFDDVHETAARFVRSPHDAVVYRSGDVARANADGTFSFRGRLDRQVQIRGQRVEPEEIEHTLRECDGVLDAAATAITRTHSVELHAFVVCDDARRTRELNRWLARRLEPWKIPSSFQFVDALPRLSNEKVDYAALGRMAERGAQPRTADARTQLIEGDVVTGPVADAWCAVLGVAEARASQDFVQLGGDSVRALELCVECARRGVAVDADAIDRSGTLGALMLDAGSGIETSALRRRAELALGGANDDIRAAPTSKSTQGAILVTGATGFFGAHFVGALAQSVRVQGDDRSRHIIAAVRADSRRSADARLRGVTGALDGVSAMRADVLRPNFGLDLDELRRTGVTDIVLSAGWVDLTRSYQALRPLHIGGTRHAIELARTLGARLHLVSSLSVFAESSLAGWSSAGESAPTLVPDGADLDLATTIYGGYAATKWVADAMVERSGIAGWTLRPGLLVGAPAAPAARSMDQLSRVCRGLAAIGQFPAARLDSSFDCTPVQAAARAFANALAGSIHDADSSADASRRVLHVAREFPTTGASLAAALERAGASMTPTLDWPPRHALASGDSDVAVALAATTSNAANRRLPRSGDLFLTSMIRFEAKCAARLDGTGVLLGQAGDAELDALVAAALRGSSHAGVDA